MAPGYKVLTAAPWHGIMCILQGDFISKPPVLMALSGVILPGATSESGKEWQGLNTSK
jgi:hypothetical protein